MINVCYRHTPQYPYPVQHNDAFDSIDWAVTNIERYGGDPENFIVGGVSAGANLAGAIVLRENIKAKGQDAADKKRKAVVIKGQLLIIPWLIVREEKFPYELMVAPEKSSRIQCADALVIPRPVVDLFVQSLRLNNNHNISTHKYLDVGLASDEEVKGMPKTAFLIAGADPLRDDGLLYARKLHRNRYAWDTLL